MRCRLICNVCYLLTLYTLSPLAQARIIDDYSLGSVNLIAGGVPVSQEVSGLDPAHTLGGARRVTAFGNVILSIDPATLETPHALFEQGITATNGYGEFAYGFDSPLNVDLTDDGATEFRVTLTGTHRADYLQYAVLYLEAPDGMGGTYTASKTFSDYITNSGGLTTGHILFSTFADVTNVSKITLTFHGAPGVSGSPPFRVMSFVTAVPEPASAVMALAMAASLACLRHGASAQRG